MERHVLPSRELETHFSEVADVSEPQPLREGRRRPRWGTTRRSRCDSPAWSPLQESLSKACADSFPLETPAHAYGVLRCPRVSGFVPEPRKARIAYDTTARLCDDQRMHAPVRVEPLLPLVESLRLKVEGGRRGQDLAVVDLEQHREVAPLAPLTFVSESAEAFGRRSSPRFARPLTSSMSGYFNALREAGPFLARNLIRRCADAEGSADQPFRSPASDTDLHVGVRRDGA